MYLSEGIIATSSDQLLNENGVEENCSTLMEHENISLRPHFLVSTTSCRGCAEQIN